MTPPGRQRPAGGGMGSGVTVLFLVLLVAGAVLAVVLVYGRALPPLRRNGERIPLTAPAQIVTLLVCRSSKAR